MEIAAPCSLLKQLIQRDLRIRYRSTLFGFFWSLSKPLTITGLFYLVFEKLLPVRGSMAGIPAHVNYGIFLAVGIITWTFYSGSLLQGIHSYQVHSHLVSRARFWRPALPLSDVFSQWIHYLFAQMALLCLLFGMSALTPSGKMAWVIPLTFLDLLLAGMITCICAGFQVMARDTFQLLELALMVGFYATPIIYPADLALGLLQAHGLTWLYLINPLVLLISIRHSILLGMEMPHLGDQWFDMLLPALILFVELVVLGWITYKMNRKVDRELVDRL